MSDFVGTQSTLSKSISTSTRVDPAHDMLAVETAKSESAPWMALAGRDPAQSEQQLDRQTHELLEYVQQQNREIDSRQAELNAQLALLDNQLRAARLHSGQTVGQDLLREENYRQEHLDADRLKPGAVSHSSAESATEPASEQGTQKKEAESNVFSPTDGHPGEGIRTVEFDDVEKVVAAIAGVYDDRAQWNETRQDTHGKQPPSLQRSDDVADGAEPRAETEADSDVDLLLDLHSEDSFPRSIRTGIDDRLGLLGSGVDMGRMASSLDAEALESEKRLLTERKVELDRRRAVLQRMQDETQALHREALEMRLVTEQLWAELTETAPTDQLHQLLQTLRSRLDNHYATMQQTLSDRKAELLSLRSRMQRKQAELREQSRKLQEWVESRHDEIKAHSAQLDAREALLDRREHRLQEEFAKWEAQRRDYKQQLNTLLRKINVAGLTEPSR